MVVDEIWRWVPCYTNITNCHNQWNKTMKETKFAMEEEHKRVLPFSSLSCCTNRLLKPSALFSVKVVAQTLAYITKIKHPNEHKQWLFSRVTSHWLVQTCSSFRNKIMAQKASKNVTRCFIFTCLNKNLDFTTVKFQDRSWTY